MRMKWNFAEPTLVALQREVRRLEHCEKETSLSTLELDAYGAAIYEISWAIAHAQPAPYGYDFSLSAECISLFLRAADMAEAERQDRECLKLFLKRGMRGPIND